jgi:hypothetical protein
MRRNLHMQGETHGDGDQTDIDDVSVHHNHNCPCEERWRKLKILVFEGTDAYGKGEAKLSNLGVFVSCYPILFPIIIVMCLCVIFWFRIILLLSIKYSYCTICFSLVSVSIIMGVFECLFLAPLFKK